MHMLANTPVVGIVVIAVIGILFLLSVGMLFYLNGRYRHLQKALSEGGERTGYIGAVYEQFVPVYRQYGAQANTPAIIDNAMTGKLGGLLFCERFLNNAVSLFVTLGLFGTFLGLSLSVQSLTELLQVSNTQEWLGVLDSVGGGLLSALSGMGVAFYTSLVGVACSIVLTVLRTAFSPQSRREKLESMTELWLDHTVAPKLETVADQRDGAGVWALKEELRAHADSVQHTLTDCTKLMEQTLNNATHSLGEMISYSKEPIQAFYDTVRIFNENVRDFSEFNYDLRGNIERMDVSLRDFADTVKRAGIAVTKENKS